MPFLDSDKKIITSLALLIGTLAGCQSAPLHGPEQLSSAELAGFWQCKTVHPAGQTIADYAYLPETGQYRSVGRVAFKIAQDKYLIYARISAGNWTLSGNRLIQRSYGSKAKPQDANLRARLQSDPKVAKALASYQQALNYPADREDTVYQVDQLTATHLAMHTQLGTQRVTVDCVKSPAERVPEILRQRPEKILALFGRQSETAVK